jgi:hypothetical protein
MVSRDGEGEAANGWVWLRVDRWLAMWCRVTVDSEVECGKCGMSGRYGITSLFLLGFGFPLGSSFDAWMLAVVF